MTLHQCLTPVCSGKHTAHMACLVKDSTGSLQVSSKEEASLHGAMGLCTPLRRTSGLVRPLKSQTQPKLTRPSASTIMSSVTCAYQTTTYRN